MQSGAYCSPRVTDEETRLSFRELSDLAEVLESELRLENSAGLALGPLHSSLLSGL